MTVNTRVLQLFMAARPDRHFIQIHRTLRLQVVPSLSELKHAQRHQSAAFIADSATLLVWEDEPTRLLERAEYIQDALMKMSWKPEPAEEGAIKDTKKPFVQIEEYNDVDQEAGLEEKPREIVLWQCIYEGATIALVMAAIGAGWRAVAVEMIQDPNWLRLAFIVVVPAQLWLALVANENSSSSKPSLATSLNWWGLSDRWRGTLSTTPERLLAAYNATRSALCLILRSKCLSTRKVSALSLSPLFVPSSRPSPRTNCRVAQPTSLSTMMVCS
jgi:hypothetical protein